MRRFALSAALIVATLAGAGAASAAELAPMAPQFVPVGNHDAVLYYTDTAVGYEVVVTFAASVPDDGTSMRTVVTLMPGQQSTLSVGGAAGSRPATLTVRRDGDTLVVLPPAVETASAR